MAISGLSEAGPSAALVVLQETPESLLDAVLVEAVAQAEAEQAQEREWPVVGSRGSAGDSAQSAVPTQNRFLSLSKLK